VPAHRRCRRRRWPRPRSTVSGTTACDPTTGRTHVVGTVSSTGTVLLLHAQRRRGSCPRASWCSRSRSTRRLLSTGTQDVASGSGALVLTVDYQIAVRSAAVTGHVRVGGWHRHDRAVSHGAVRDDRAHGAGAPGRRGPPGVHRLSAVDPLDQPAASRSRCSTSTAIPSRTRSRPNGNCSSSKSCTSSSVVELARGDQSAPARGGTAPASRSRRGGRRSAREGARPPSAARRRAGCPA